MIENITPIDSLVSEGQKLDYICKTVDTISDNTAAFDGFFGFSTINTLFAFGASIVTIAGIGAFSGSIADAGLPRRGRRKSCSISSAISL